MKTIKSRKVRAILIVVAGLVAYMCGFFISIPGIDPDVARRLLGAATYTPSLYRFLGLDQPLVGISFLSLGGFVFFRMGAFLTSTNKDEKRAARNRRFWYWAYLVIIGIQAYGVSTYLLSLNITSPFGPVVRFSEPYFSIVTVAIFVCLHALVWLLASWITKIGLANGTLLMFGTHQCFGGINSLFTAGANVGLGNTFLSEAAFYGLTLAPYIMVCALLVWYSPESWPVKFRNQSGSFLPAKFSWLQAWPNRLVEQSTLVSPVDLLMVPAVLAVATAPWELLGLKVGSLDAVITSFLPWAEGWFVVVVLTGLLAIPWIRFQKPSNPRYRYVFLALAWVLASYGIMAVGFTAEDGIARWFGPGPFAGENSYRIVLKGTQETAEYDAQIFEYRLKEGFELDAEVRVNADDSLSIELHQVVDPAELLDIVVRPGRFTMTFVSKDQSLVEPKTSDHPLPDNVKIFRSNLEQSPAAPARSENFYVAPSFDELSFLAERIHALDDVDWGVFYTADDGETGWMCRIYVLDYPPLFSNEDLDAAWVEIQDAQVGARPYIQLTEQAAVSFADVTGDNVGRRLAIIIDGMIYSAPTIMERIPSGTLSFNTGATDVDDSEWSADVIAMLLRSGALESQWEVSSVEKL